MRRGAGDGAAQRALNQVVILGSQLACTVGRLPTGVYITGDQRIIENDSSAAWIVVEAAAVAIIIVITIGRVAGYCNVIQTRETGSICHTSTMTYRLIMAQGIVGQIQVQARTDEAAPIAVVRDVTIEGAIVDRHVVGEDAIHP